MFWLVLRFVFNYFFIRIFTANLPLKEFLHKTPSLQIEQGRPIGMIINWVIPSSRNQPSKELNKVFPSKIRCYLNLVSIKLVRA